jgi:hypothetical protein
MVSATAFPLLVISGVTMVLGRKGALATVPLSERNGFSVFPVGDSQVKFGLEDVQAAPDAEDARSARDFLKPDSR